jgi:hypothetical protein
VLCAGGDAAGLVDGVGGGGARAAELPARSIVTSLVASARGGLEADVVVRVDGLPWPLDVPLAVPRADGGEPRPVLLVDLDDHQDHVARDAARARRLDYRGRGWGR